MYYPLKLDPVFKNYIWGGRKLVNEYNKVSTLEKVAEAWELALHKDGESHIANGELKGDSLSEVIDFYGYECLGVKANNFTEFPIFIKLIDACDALSIQVHPDDEYAKRVEGEPGKTEMWYVVEADEGAKLIYGFNEVISKEQYRSAIENNTLEDLLTAVPVKKGDVFFIEAGTVHAIGKGLLIAEIQQNSNTTYRVYDYARVQKDGSLRPLHIEKAIDVSTLAPARNNAGISEWQSKDGYNIRSIARCKYFSVDEIKLQTSAKLLTSNDSFAALNFVEGSGEIIYGGKSYPYQKGDSYLMLANMGEYEIKGYGNCLISKI